MPKVIKRALIVDDSRSARISLKNLLSEHDLEISLAASGEEALDFLKRESVDVIFMDHTMPGMDGLEAVSAIKANPQTATIPVMMYTTREGEVYVGQARALGAVGVLPKNVQPHQLFEMLLKLGLVKDRRSPAAESVEADTGVPHYDLDDGLDAEMVPVVGTRAPEAPDELEQQALGISVQTVVSRILEDQHVTLRSDILRSQRSFAKDVAREVLREHYAREVAAGAEEAWEDQQRLESSQLGAQLLRYRLVAGIAMIFVVVSSFLGWQFKQQRDVALNNLERVQAQARILSFSPPDISTSDGSEEAQAQTTHAVASSTLEALQWSLNQGNDTAMYEWAFSDALANKLQGMLDHLENLGFQGEIKLTSHLGRFCLQVDDNGTYVLANEDLLAANCDYSGHVLDHSSFVTDRLGPEFAKLIERVNGGVQLNLVALYASDSTPRVPYPPGTARAGDWNAVARQNNRVEVELIPQVAARS